MSHGLFSPVKEYSVQQGSSGFSKGPWPGMDPFEQLLDLRQGSLSIEEYVTQFCNLSFKLNFQSLVTSQLNFQSLITSQLIFQRLITSCLLHPEPGGQLFSIPDWHQAWKIYHCCHWAAYSTMISPEVAANAAEPSEVVALSPVSPEAMVSTAVSPEVAAHAADPSEAAVLTSAHCMVVAPSNSLSTR
ncbi:hypothetical protein cypCar_00032816 [Cyprinus carpio]|nr:hypothetical protein cypCar_00032816 [Cyprinus carpio]